MQRPLGARHSDRFVDLRAMAGLDRVPAPPTLMDATSTIGGPVGRKVNTGFGGVTPIQARGSVGIPADLYGLHQEEILRQPGVTLGAGLIPHADFGIPPSEDLVGLRADLIKRLGAKLPRGVG